MQLRDEQRAILDGSRGEVLARCMRWLVDWGDVMGARRLVPVDNTHVLLPVPNLMARGASEETLARYMADLEQISIVPELDEMPDAGLSPREKIEKLIQTIKMNSLVEF